MNDTLPVLCHPNPPDQIADDMSAYSRSVAFAGGWPLRSQVAIAMLTLAAGDSGKTEMGRILIRL